MPAILSSTPPVSAVTPPPAQQAQKSKHNVREVKNTIGSQESRSSSPDFAVAPLLDVTPSPAKGAFRGVLVSQLLLAKKVPNPSFPLAVPAQNCTQNSSLLERTATLRSPLPPPPARPVPCAPPSWLIRFVASASPILRADVKGRGWSGAGPGASSPQHQHIVSYAPIRDHDPRLNVRKHGCKQASKSFEHEHVEQPLFR